jgi:hypothetical protein
MKKVLIVMACAASAALVRPTPASADVTFFLGLNPQPAVHSVRGVSAGISMLIVGFEFDYAVTREDETREIPGLQTGMFNLLVQTPTNTSLYVTAGVGLYRESLLGDRVTNVGTNVGGGIKISLFGPLKARIDYRVFALRGNPRYPKPQRLYVGINWMF